MIKVETVNASASWVSQLKSEKTRLQLFGKNVLVNCAIFFLLLSFLVLPSSPLLCSAVMQSPVRPGSSPVPAWFPVTRVPEITTSLKTAARSASPAPSMEPPPWPGPPPSSTAPVRNHNDHKSSHRHTQIQTNTHTRPPLDFQYGEIQKIFVVWF